jgi:hypothetical protein
MIALTHFETYAVGGDNVGEELPIPQDTNGHSTAVGIDDAADHVDDKNVILLGADGVHNLEAQLMHEVWVEMGKPTADAPIVMTQAHLDVLAMRFAVRIGQHTLLAAYAHTRRPAVGEAPLARMPPLGTRESDVIRVPDFARLIGAAGDALRRVAVQLYKVVERDTQARRLILKEDTATGRFVVICVPANAMHRHFDDKHNWRTKTVEKKNSPASKALRLAAADQDAFKKFMAEWGHDLFHWLDDEAVLNLSNAIAGTEPTVMVNWVYMGVDQVGKELCEVLKVSTAVKERMPPGVLGIAAVMTGVKALKAMLGNMAYKIGFSELTATTAALTRIAAWVSTAGARFPRLARSVRPWRTSS